MNLSLASNDQDDDVKTAVTVVIKRFMNCSPGFSWTTGPIIIPRTAQIQTELCFHDKLESLILKFADFLQSGFTNVDRSEDFPPPTILCFTSLETCHVSFSSLCFSLFFCRQSFRTQFSLMFDYQVIGVWVQHWKTNMANRLILQQNAENFLGNGMKFISFDAALTVSSRTRHEWIFVNVVSALEWL